ncbi:hemolysin [Methylorubrum populi]|uniref:Hemolysin n=1 Tax=Methylobacterium radiotolerans TaxID=31998 RepID=A0ABU7TB69_9HYPH
MGVTEDEKFYYIVGDDQSSTVDYTTSFKAIQVNAGGGEDIIYGSTADDFIYGEAGNDTIFGGYGKDYLNGGDGDDLITNGGQQPLHTGNDHVRGGAGNDTLYFLNSLDGVALFGDEGDDSIQGGMTADIIYGDAEVESVADGNDYIRGGEGADLIYGGGGADTIRGSYNDGSDKVYGGTGNDLIVYTNDLSAVKLYGDEGNDTINGGFGDDKIFGGADNDILTGGYGNDAIDGGTGADRLDGGFGADVLTGGNDADVFMFTTRFGNGNVDHITDFSTGDKIYLAKALISGSTEGALVASAFKDLSLGRADANDRVLYNQASGELSYDADGSGSAAKAVVIAVLDNHASLTFQDFLIG